MRACLALAAFCCVFANPAFAENYLVLPFFNLSKNANLDWVGESLAENISETLAGQGVLTLDREGRQEAYRRLSIKAYSTLTKASVIRVAESLDADQVIFGSFELLAPSPGATGRGTLKIVAQILDLRRAKQGPEFTELGALDDLARLQTHLGWQALQFVNSADSPSEEEFRKSQPVVRLEAVESYVRGLLASAPDQKLKMFSQAVQLDPRYSQANFQLGRLQWQRKAYRPAADALLRVAITDVHYREATFLLGLCRYRLGDYNGAESAFRTVAAAVPLNEVWNNLGAAQSRKNSPEAAESFRKALEGDATDPDYQFNFGLALFRSGDLKGAAERFRAVLDRVPDDAAATLMLGRSLQAGTAGRQPGQVEPSERIKDTYEESAYWQLKALIERNK